MILFRCKCGKLLAAEISQSGSVMDCPACHETMTVPAESLKNCYMIFTQGAPACGIPMSWDDITQAIAEKKLSGYDLIRYEDQWYPLNRLAEISTDNDRTPNNALDELAMIWEEMPPIPGFAELPPAKRYDKERAKRGAESPFRQRKLKKDGKTRAEAGALIQNPHMDGPARKHVSGRLYALTIAAAIPILVVLTLLVLWGTHKSGRRTSALFLANQTGQAARITVPFLSINAQAAPGSITSLPDIATPFGLNATVKLNDAPVASVRFAPHVDTLLNIDSSMRFLLFRDLDETVNRPMRSTLISELFSQISENNVPQSVFALADSIHQKITSEIFAGYSQEPLYTSQNYVFHNLGLNYGTRGAPPAAYSSGKLYLCPDETIDLTFSNGKFTYCASAQGAAARHALTLAVPKGTEFNVNGTRLPAEDDLILSVGYRGEFTRVEMHFHQPRKQKDENGFQAIVTWSYIAEFQNETCVKCQWIPTYHSNRGERRIGTPVDVLKK